LEELIPSMVSIFLLNFESVLFISFFVLFDFRTLLIQLIIMISLLLSIISSAVIFNLTLNIVTLYHFLLLPALICEFIFNIPYFYLFKASLLRKEQKQEQKLKLKEDASSSNEIRSEASNMDDKQAVTSDDIIPESSYSFKVKTNQLHSSSVNTTASSNLTQKYRLKQLEYAYDNGIKPTSYYILIIVMLNFSIMYSCTTYNFQTLYLFLMSLCFNLFLHLFFFYPNLLVLFGTCWAKEAKKDSIDLIINV